MCATSLLLSSVLVALAAPSTPAPAGATPATALPDPVAAEALVATSYARTPAGAVPLDQDDLLIHEARSRWRLGFAGGFAKPKNISGAPGGDVRFDGGFTTSGLVGYRLASLTSRVDLDAELEGYYAQADVKRDGFPSVSSASGDSGRTASFLLNGVLGWHWTDSISVYAGAGIGWAEHQFDVKSDLPNSFSIGGGHRATGLAAQGKVGILYSLGGGFGWTVAYRYFATESFTASDPAIGQSFDLTNKVQSIEVGVRYEL